jgi:SsrA-binding protein
VKLASAERGLTIVPIAVYNKGRKIKVEIATVRGKKKFDKRETMKKKDAKREIDRTLKYK